MLPYLGIERDRESPKKGKHENRNRQRKNRNRDRNKERRQNLRFEKIRRIQCESGCLRKSSGNKQVTDNDQGKLALPKVWRPDNLAIKPPKEIKATENKCFHAETIVDFNPIPYDFNNLTNELSTETTFNHSFGDYDYCDDDIIIKNPIQNPTEKYPVSIAEFLGKHLDLTSIRNIFNSQYGTVDYHYRFPLDAMIKSSMVRRIRCMRSFQKLVNRFETNQQDAHAIGFENNGNGRFQIPDRRTFRHWENIRIDNHTLEIAMDLHVRSLRKELEKQNIILGRRIGIDSTPLEALFNDEDAKYSGHYEKTGYKIHGAYDLDRNIPLAIIITTMNEADPNYFIPLLEKLQELGINFEKIFADGAYDTFEHFALVHLVYNAKFYTNPGTNAVYNDKGTSKGIQHEYNKFWKNKDYVLPNKVTLQDKLEYLMKHDKIDVVGAYFRNQFLKKWEKWQEEKQEGNQIAYNNRNAAEGYHGFVKKYLNLQNYFDYRGIKNVERHVRWTYLAILGIALARAQNGIVEDLTQIAFFE
ncbi:MAG: transposase [Candidatus Hodarchaeota archaeon]